MKISDKVTDIKGIGTAKAALLKKLNIEKAGDFLSLYPREYQDRRTATKIKDLILGKPFLVKVTISAIINNNSYYKKINILRLLAEDDSGSLEIIFFNAKYLTKSFKRGEEYYFYGRISTDKGNLQMQHPEFYLADEPREEGIIPIYPLTSGIHQRDMRKWQKTVLTCLEETEECLPNSVIERNRLCGISYAMQNIHFPEDEQKMKAAKFRLIFDELFFLQLGLMLLQYHRRTDGGIKFPESDTNKYIKSLPYQLTNAQSKVLSEIIRDMESEAVMNRLVQGDVGSGKTAVAEIALYKACMGGYQGVLMAPTELLANQHYQSLRHSFAPFGIEVSFLSGSMSAKEKKDIIEELKEGKTGILIGTHAIIQPGVEFQNLGIVITDEQHRFGVNQRLKLVQKGKNPDVLVMSATPIPRTLAMIVYGDLDISIIDELPPGRKKIVTKAVNKTNRDSSYEFVRNEIQAGRQAYIVTALIEDSDSIEASSAKSVYMDLTERFSEYVVALLHGDMKQSEKDEIMKRFYDGEINVLVSTVVIEVGINVPNATVMLIENAERFGLAQLHQLRGRVGRGSAKSYCILMIENETALAIERANALVKISDGFEIAEKDLSLRGPGDFFGTKQHGLPDLRIADLVKHIKILETVREEARLLLQVDPDLSSPENFLIKQKIQQQFNAIL